MVGHCDNLLRRIVREGRFTWAEAEMIVAFMDREGELVFNSHGSMTVRHQDALKRRELEKVFACARVAA